jgi:sugar phosphate isomerase/epimerase
MRYGYVSNGLADHRIDDALELLADNGYAGVALTLDHVHFDPLAPRLRARAARLRLRLESLGLACVVETGARFVLDPRRKHFPTLVSDGRERRVDLLCRAVDVAAELGAPVVSLWSGTAPPDLAPARAWDLLVDGVARVLEYAQRAGITLAFEPEPGMLVEQLYDYELLERRLGRPENLAITLDVGHCVCIEDESPQECIRRAGARLAHVHIEDMVRGVHEHLMFGEGELDLPAALAALEDIGYSGLVSVELSRHAHRAHEVVPAAMGALRAAEEAAGGERGAARAPAEVA